MLRDGEVLDERYQIIREIGKGGTGIVYLAYHLTLCKYVVIKKIKDNFVGNINARGEVDILKKLHHRYLPQVYDFLMIGTGVYTVMDYVDGHDLSWFVENGYVFTEDQLICMLMQLCEVLQYLHSQKPPIVHSDIKPGNIMIRSDGDVCLIDFNISLDSEEQQVLGYSPHFAAPEQLKLAWAVRYGKKTRHLKVDARSDVYSLGASFYYLMTGILPQQPAVPLKKLQTCYSRDLTKIVQKAMEPSRQKRYAGAAGMLFDLEQMHTGQKRLLLWLLAALLVLLASGGIAAGVYSVSQDRQQRFVQAFSEFNLQRQYGEPLAVREQGMGILNDGQMKRQLESHQEQKADILAGIAESYYEEENYSAAAVFYRDALECRTDPERQVKCLRDYIISLIRSGQRADAQRELDAAQAVFSEDILVYLQAELFLEAEEEEEAYALFQTLMEDSQDREIRMRSCLQAADCLKNAGRERERMEVLSQAQQLVGGRLLYRKIGEAYVEIAQTCREASLVKEALLQAETCYALLCRDEDAGYLDRLNYATVLEMQGDFRSSFAVLNELEEDFPKDYRTYREEAWLCYWTELEKDAPKQDFQGVLYYGRLAFERYSETDRADEKMARLKELMEQLSR